MVKKIAILIMIVGVSSKLNCMRSLARLAASAAKATRLASRCKELAAKRTLIYWVRDRHDTANRDETFDKIEVESRMDLGHSNLFGTYTVGTQGQTVPQITKSQRYPIFVAKLTYPQHWYHHVLRHIPGSEDKKRFYLSVAGFFYPRFTEPKYFCFEDNKDIADIITAANTDKEILCAGDMLFDDGATY